MKKILLYSIILCALAICFSGCNNSEEQDIKNNIKEICNEYEINYIDIQIEPNTNSFIKDKYSLVLKVKSLTNKTNTEIYDFMMAINAAAYSSDFLALCQTENYDYYIVDKKSIGFKTSSYLFCDLYQNNVVLFHGVKCENKELTNEYAELYKKEQYARNNNYSNANSENSYTYTLDLSYNDKIEIATRYLELEKKLILSRNDYDTLSELKLKNLYGELDYHMSVDYPTEQEDNEMTLLDENGEIYKEAFNRLRISEYK